MTLTAKQQRFVAEYLIDLNATQAAIRTGYSRKTAESQGWRLLRNAKIAAAIEAKRAKSLAKLEITADSIKAELAKIGFANMADYMRVGADGDPVLDFSSLSRDQAAVLSEVTVEQYTEGRGEDAERVKRVKFKLHDKRAALVDLGKHLGMFKEPGSSPDVPLHVAPSADTRELAKAIVAVLAGAVKAST